MAASDQRKTVLDIINEVRIKQKLNPVSTLTQDSDAISKLSYLNDVLAEIADYGDWQEMLREIVVTATTGVSDYSIPVSAINVVQNIHEIVWADDVGEMRKVPLDQIRRLSRTGSTGQPSQWSVIGTDSNANPVFRVYPTPGTVEDGETFKVLAYEKPALLVTADATTIPNFPSRVLVQGLFCKAVLDESDGEPTTRYQNSKEIYNDLLNQSFNRYNGDTGSTIYFKPSWGRR